MNIIYNKWIYNTNKWIEYLFCTKSNHMPTTYVISFIFPKCLMRQVSLSLFCNQANWSLKRYNNLIKFTQIPSYFLCQGTSNFKGQKNQLWICLKLLKMADSQAMFWGFESGIIGYGYTLRIILWGMEHVSVVFPPYFIIGYFVGLWIVK